VHELSQVDLTDLDRFAAGFPHDIFRLHRDQAPVWWHEPTVHTPDGKGFWSLPTSDEVLQVLDAGIRHLQLRLHKAATTSASATGM
jgi:hypothetical protein